MKKKSSYVVTWSKKLSKWKKSLHNNNGSWHQVLSDNIKPVCVIQGDLTDSYVQQLVESAPQDSWYRVVSDKWNNDKNVKHLIVWLDTVIENPCFVKSRIGTSYDSGVQIWFNNKDDLTAFALAWNVNILTYRHFTQSDFANHISDWLVDFNRIQHLQ